VTELPANGVASYTENFTDSKHSRVLNFSKANLLNVLNAVAAVFIVLYARYGIAALNQHQENSSWETDKDDFVYKETSLFKIKSSSQDKEVSNE